MVRKRVLIISHTYAAPVNRLKFDIMAMDQRFKFLLVTPRKWQNTITIADNSSEFDNKKYRIIYADVLLGWHPVTYLIPRLGKVIQGFKPHLIYCEQEPICLISLQTAILGKKGIPIIYFTWENIDRRDSRYRMFWFVRSFCLRRSLFIAAGSEEAASVIRKHRYKKPIYITPILGVSEKLFYPKDVTMFRQNLTQRSFLIGYVGRFVDQKDVVTLIKAVSTLYCIDWHLMLVGGGPQRNDYEELIQKLGIADRVTFQSAIPHEGVPELLNCFDVLVLPSRTTPTWKEQFGHVLIEAMACGVPVVGSSSGEIPKVIGDAGLVFKEGDFKDLSAKLTKLFNDSSLRETLRQRGLQRVKNRYTDTQIAANMIALYEIALAMEKIIPNTLEVAKA